MRNEAFQKNHPDDWVRSSSSEKELRWNPWPCSACRGGVSPIGYLLGRAKANSAFPASNPEEVVKWEAAWLTEWAKQCPHERSANIHVKALAEGSEHLVFLDEGLGQVFKATKVGLYGESYFLANGKINQKNCTPREYLVRLRLWGRLFGSAPDSLGITDLGQIISTHRFITGVPPTQVEVDDFLLSAGLKPIKQKFWLWAYQKRDFKIWLGDARADNFVKSKAGIVPIDIRLWE